MRGARNFSLRLSTEDHVRLRRIAERLAVDRTEVLRQLIRRASGEIAREGQFTIILHGRSGHRFCVSLIRGNKDGI
jgi:cytidylate kinase